MSEQVPASLRQRPVQNARTHACDERTPAALPETHPQLEWIQVAPGAPYFQTISGSSWTPIGHNEAITWPRLSGLFLRKDPGSVEAYFASLADSGVTCLRLMLEYAQGSEHYLEQPVGSFVPAMVRLWDDLFAMAEKYGVRFLLTPFDTFWTWIRWSNHPYNKQNGGVLDSPSRLLLCRQTRAAIKNRLTFAVERWGGSGALFAWDLWNEIHPSQAEESAECFSEFIHDLSVHVRSLERRLYGRSHLQTVSLFGPELSWRPKLNLGDIVFRHPDLDFATVHVYDRGTIDDPHDTVAPALAMGRLVGEAIQITGGEKPFLDSEHGPIHRFKDHAYTLPADFDDECFRHTQWAHLAAGGAGGGMRWPNRHPHQLTPGMHAAQRSLAGFVELLDWNRFRRRLVDIGNGDARVQVTACCDYDQAVVWMVRSDTIGRRGRLRRAAGIAVELALPDLAPGTFRVTWWDTASGAVERSCLSVVSSGATFRLTTPNLRADVAIAVRRV